MKLEERIHRHARNSARVLGQFKDKFVDLANEAPRELRHELLEMVPDLNDEIGRVRNIVPRSQGDLVKKK